MSDNPAMEAPPEAPRPRAPETDGTTTPVRHEVLPDGVRKIVFDTGAGGPPFSLDGAALDRLEELISSFAGEGDVSALLFSSTHEKVFCAGADVEAMARITSREDAGRLIQRGQQVFEHIAHLPFPTVALIHGTCVGGGLELALACDARAATPDKATRLGLPETKLGIIPAWGGSTRLPRLIGVEQAISLVTAGRTVGAARALRLGIVDGVVPREHLVREGLALAARQRQGTLKRPGGGLRRALLEGNPLGRSLLGRMAHKAVRKATHGHYPAPEAALRVMLQAPGARVAQSLARESEEVLPLLDGPVHENLLRLFRITREGARPEVYRSGRSAPPVESAAVIGAGVMGAGIAVLLALKGIPVRLVDPVPGALANAWNLLQKELERRHRRRDLAPHDVAAIKAAFSVSTELCGLARADVVIEAATERREIKEDILRRASEAVREDAIIATNTSSYAIEELAAAVSRPERFLGLHFFNPPLKMPLLEIVRGADTAETAVASGLALCARAGKTPVVVGDGPGFLVNRLLTPYLLDACRLAQEGVAPGAIDRALLAFGMPMGPFRLMDEVGLDVMRHAGEHIAERTNDGMTLHPFIEELAEKGCLGKKSGEGFYRYGKGRRRLGPTFSRLLAATGSGNDSRSGEELAERLVKRMVAEGRKVMGEGLALCTEDVDIATVFGIGFPPWRGGLLHFAQTDHASGSEEDQP